MSYIVYVLPYSWYDYDLIEIFFIVLVLRLIIIHADQKSNIDASKIQLSKTHFLKKKTFIFIGFSCFVYSLSVLNSFRVSYKVLVVEMVIQSCWFSTNWANFLKFHPTGKTLFVICVIAWK